MKKYIMFHVKEKTGRGVVHILRSKIHRYVGHFQKENNYTRMLEMAGSE